MVHQVPGARFSPSELPPGRVPVLFQASWCGYSRRFYLQFRQRFQHGWAVDVSDTDDPLWDGLDVVPTVVVYEDGVPVGRWEGVLGEAHAEEIARHLANA